MKRILIALLGAAVSLHGTSATAADVKVGSAGGITGPIAELVVAIVAARNLAASHVNEQGGLLGGDTYQLVSGDSQCDPKAAVDAGTKLVNVEQVVGVVGPSCSGATNGMAQSVTIPAGVVMLSDTATSPAISELEDNDLVFRAAPSDGYQSGALAQHVWDKGLRNIAVTYANDDYNAGLGEAFIAAFEQIGGTISGKQAHEPDRQSYRSELSTLAGGGAEALAVFAYYGGSGITILRNSLENALFDQFLGADGMMDNSVIEQLGADTLRGKVTLSQPAPEAEGDSGPGESYTAFAEAFKAAGHDPAAPYVSHGYDVAFLMALAIEKAGAADRGMISAALREVANAPGMVIRPGEWAKAREAIAAGEDINYEGASGAIEFDENGDVAGTYSLNVVGDDGTWTPEE
jgi:branched-chain amino acid transport system substrate-binding protein